MGDLFYGPKLKIERARQHIEEFENMVSESKLLDMNMLATAENDPADTLRELVKIPQKAPLIVGDAIHNLRSSLDHAYCVLVELNKKTVGRNTAFPFAELGGKAKKISSVRKDEARPNDEVLDYIFNVMKPFEEDDSELYAVHRLDIADKHKLLIKTVALATIHSLTFGDDLGNVSTIKGLKMLLPPGLAAFGFDRGVRPISSDPANSFDVQFAWDEHFGGQNVGATLNRLLGLTEDAISALSALHQHTA